MSAFDKLLDIPAAEQLACGLEHTPKEIAQQPAVWQKAVEQIIAQRDKIGQFLLCGGLTGNLRTTLIFTGAGSSEFVGTAAATGLRAMLNRTVLSIPTTHIVTHPTIFTPGEQYVILSFARSGNSPESVATWNLVKQVCPSARQIVITCNSEGALARAAQDDRSALAIILPPETNDKSLVMTSSYSTMAMAALSLGMLQDADGLRSIIKSAAAGALRLLGEGSDTLHRFTQRPFNRICYLGSGGMYGTAQECHLKTQEMSEGQVVAMFNSFVGLRHGPQVFINDQCLTVAMLSSDPYIRAYEIDMLAELKAKRQGAGTLVITANATPNLADLADEIIELYPGSTPLPDTWRILTDVLVGQIVGTFKCLSLGLKPDNPSTSGTISRVVQGVNIYPCNVK